MKEFLNSEKIIILTNTNLVNILQVQNIQICDIIYNRITKFILELKIYEFPTQTM